MSDLEELRRLSDAATPGPWRAFVGADSLIHRPDGSHMNLGDAIYHDRYAADATFIVALVNAYRDGSLSNPTSSVSTEGVAEIESAARHLLDVWPTRQAREDARVTLATAVHRTAAARFTAINPDSPVEPDRG